MRAVAVGGAYPEEALSVPPPSSSLQLLAGAGVPVGSHSYIGLGIQVILYEVMCILQEEVVHGEGAAPCSKRWGAPKVVGEEMRVQSR